ncbi:pentatricopeptide repeat-containing protein [Portibacter marinus]|uniref:pentatricopeptide repeat-containing protein n=1 Tax=Portibacter marinus TaxID=2898660 RepID=UPI001F2585DF|nr:hypothetical protein [Portibacter marinus]
MKEVFTYCLTIDIVSSTRRLLEESTEVRNRFNIGLSKILPPFLKDYDLEDSIVKFTGDGWNINITQSGKLINLLTFILTFNKLFNERIQSITGIEFKKKWNLRSAISSGSDIKLEINGNSDFVGDSIRRAVRVSSFCDTDDILVDYSIYRDVVRDFNLELKKIDVKGSNKKFEFDIGEQLYSLIEAKFNDLANASIILKHFDDIGHIVEKNKIIEKTIKASSSDQLSDTELNNLDTIAVTLEQVGNRVASKEVYQKLKEKGYSRKLVSWNILMNKVDDFSSAKQVLDEMKQEGIKPNEVTYSTLMNKVDDFSSAKQVLDEMKEEGIKPDEVTFNTLMNKVDDFSSAKQVLDEMKQEGIKPDEVTFNTLMNKVDDFSSAKQVLDEMKQEGIKPNEVTYSTLMNKVGDFSSAKQVLDEMKQEGIKPNEVTFNTLMNKVDDFSSAKQVLDEMKQEGIKPNEVTFNTLMNKVDDFSSTKQVLDEMKQEGIKPDEITYSTLMNQVDDFSSAKQVLDEMKEEGIKPDEITYSTLMNKVDDFSSAKQVLDEMKQEGIKPNEITFNTLMNKVDDFSSAKQVLDEMKQEGIKPNEVTYSTLMNKVDDFSSAKQVLDEMKQEEIKPDLITYSTLFAKDTSGLSIRTIHLWYVQENDFHPSGPIEGLIKNLFNSNQIKDVYYLILHYPHLPISKKILSQNLEKAIENLEQFSKEKYYLEHINYAKGITYHVNSKYEKLNYHLKSIKDSNLGFKKKRDIEKLIELNENYP